MLRSLTSKIWKILAKEKQKLRRQVLLHPLLLPHTVQHRSSQGLCPSSIGQVVHRKVVQPLTPLVIAQWTMVRAQTTI